MKKLFVASLALATLAACSKDKDPIIVVPPSSGSTMTLNGGDGGASAVNSVFVDFSTDKQDSVKRASWDLGFYCGSDFRVIINNTIGATAKVTTKTDINAVGTADTAGLNKLTIGYDATSFSLIDDVTGDLTKTLIPAISTTDTDNKVVIINRHVSTNSTSDSNWYKIRILRTSNGYTLQYGKLSATTFSTLNINKDDSYNFKYASLDKGEVLVEPVKTNWDIRWSYTLYKTYYSAITADIPYGNSDFITTNNKGGTQAFLRSYASSDDASLAYTTFNKDSVAKYTFSNAVDIIGNTWRNTTGTVGVIKQNFYIVKDAAGNVYKLKFLSFTTQDGGTRGKPEIHYELISK